MTSRYLPKATRDTLQAQPTCRHCNGPGPFEADHGRPKALGGDNSPRNMQRLCIPCHAKKTKIDVYEIAKAKRIARKLAGTWRKPKRPMKSAGFRKDIRRRMEGTVEKRT